MERNVALHRAAWHSSAANFSNTAHLITDDYHGSLPESIDCGWISSGDRDEWVYIDLGVQTRIYKAVVHWGGKYALSYAVQVSDDAGSWSTADSAKGMKNTAVESVLDGIAARFIRIYCDKSSEDCFIIRRVEVFGENELEYKLPPMPTADRLGTQVLTGGSWKVRRASCIPDAGPEISDPCYSDLGWLPACVPGTVLASYIKAGAVPDPNYDDWQFQISEAYFTADFWYRNTFVIPESKKGRRVFLNFDAVNWKADVYFNGRFLPNERKDRKHSIEGAFIRGKFDITEQTRYGEENCLAVHIYKNDNPGEVTTQGLAEGPGPNGGALGADNPTLHATVGWDWLPTIRGRGIGIYGDVYLTYSGSVSLLDPWIETGLEIKQVSSNLEAENLMLLPGVTVKGRDGEIIETSEGRFLKQWIGRDADGDGFVVDFGDMVTCGSVTLFWGTEAGGAAADLESRHPEKFRLEASADGTVWSNFDAYPGGSVDTGWFGVLEADPAEGTCEYNGHAGSDSVQGSTAFVPVDMSAWGRGVVSIPVFSPQKVRFLRFTAIKRRSLNGEPAAARVREIRVYSESPVQVEQSMTRKFSLDSTKARLTFRAEIKNHEDRPVTVTVGGVIYEAKKTFVKSFDLTAGETRSIEICGIILENPRLWWPNTYGEQFLYTVDAFALATEKVEREGYVDIFGFLNSPRSDVKRFRFGVRKFTYSIDGGLLTLYCNGCRIVARGGNWGMDDGLKLDTAEEYDGKVRLHREANMNMIRNWVGMTNNPAFYEACDKYGIMIWDDFWLANPVDGPDPNDPEMFLQNAADKIRKNRSHAALVIYCGRNEGDPPAELDEGLRKLTAELDGTRFYISNSASMPVGSGGGYSLAKPGGGRGIKQYFDDVTSPVLRSERGIPNVPSLESLRKFIAPENLWPISEVWALHDWTYHMNGPANTYMEALKCYLGGDYDIPEDNVRSQKPDPEDPVFRAYKADILKMVSEAGKAYTLEDFCRAAQMINYENHRGLFEALAARRSNGLLMWMSQSAWPSLMWQTYDWYLDTNGGYFGVKAGNQPVRAIWDPRNDGIILTNLTPNIYLNVRTIVTVYDMTGLPVLLEEIETERLEADACGLIAGKADFSASKTDIVFLRLILKNSEGDILGENFYWHNKREYMNYRALGGLPEGEPETVLSGPDRLPDGNVRYTLMLSNKCGAPLLQIRVRVVDSGGNDILPVFYSDNYFSLMPGDAKTVTAEFYPKQTNSLEDVRFILGGWNIKSNF